MKRKTLLNQMNSKKSKLLLRNYNKKRFESDINFPGLTCIGKRLKEHLFRKGLVLAPTCRFCEDQNKLSGYILGAYEVLMHFKWNPKAVYQVLGVKLVLLSQSCTQAFFSAVGLDKTSWESTIAAMIAAIMIIIIINIFNLKSLYRVRSAK